MKIKKYKSREEIPSLYKWDLNSIYQNIDKYQEDMDNVNKINEEIKTFKGKILSSSSNLLKVLELCTKQEVMLDKMVNYVNLNRELDTRDGYYNVLMSKLEDFYTSVYEVNNIIEEELKSLNEKTLDEFIHENSELKKYEFMLRKVIKNNKHLLSFECENLLAQLSPVLDAGSNISSLLNDADSDYGSVLDKDGHSHELTASTFNTYVSSTDRVLRKNADEVMHEYYKKHANSFAECLSNHIKTTSISAKLRKYDSSLQMCLHDDNIDENFYDGFIKSVNDNLGVLHRMMSLYKKVFGLDEMHTYDIRCKVDAGVDNTYTIEEMQDILLNALKPLGTEYIDAVKEAFNNNWIDYYETKGKRSGAFSTTTTTVKPYLLLNYTGSFDDLETFAHELGHSIHTYFANKYRTPVDANYPIFLAEIASTTNELLLNNYLLNNTDDKNMKKYILNNLISMYRATIFRQAEFAEFERDIFSSVDKGEFLSKDDYTDLYMKLQKKYYGKDVIQDEYIKYECFRIPHFYYNFYVYKYATSLAIAYRFAYGIINNEDNVLENYLKLLKSGGKDYPLNILKECGIDVNSKNLLDYSIKMINNYMDEFESLMSRK